MPSLESIFRVRGAKSLFDSIGPSRHFAATQQLGRSRRKADIERFSVCTEPVAFDPGADIAAGRSRAGYYAVANLTIPTTGSFVYSLRRPDQIILILSPRTLRPEPTSPSRSR